MAEENKTNETLEEDSSNESEENEELNEANYKKLQSESIKRKISLREKDKKLGEVEAELKKLKDEKLSDSEKKDSRIKELEKQVEALTEEGKSIKLDSSILGIASTKGFKYLDVVLLLAKKELASEEEADDKTIEKIVDQIAKEKPELLSVGEITTPGAGNREKQELESKKTPDEMFGEFLHGK